MIPLKERTMICSGSQKSWTADSSTTSLTFCCISIGFSSNLRLGRRPNDQVRPPDGFRSSVPSKELVVSIEIGLSLRDGSYALAVTFAKKERQPARANGIKNI